MALTSGILPNLLGGISQQPDILRHPTQLEEQKNMTTSLVEGLSKRPPCEYWGYLGDDKVLNSQAFFHWIDRDPTERYLLILKDNATPIVYDLVNKTFETVNEPDGHAYLNVTGQARTAFKAITVADFTFIVNTEMTAQKVDTATTPSTGTVTFDANVSDADTVIIGDGVLEVAFEFDNNASVTTGRTLVTIGASRNDTAENLKLAIEASGLRLTVERTTFVLTLTNDQRGTSGNVTITKSAVNLTVAGMTGGTGSSVRSSVGQQGAIVNVAVPGNDTRYLISDEEFGTIADFTSSDTGVVQAQTISADLETDIDGFGSLFDALRANESLFVRRVGVNGGSRKMDLTVFSSNTQGGLLLVQDQVQSFTNLPIKGRRGYVVEVTGDPGTPFDNYYVRSQIPGGGVPGADSIGDILWEETVAPDIQYKLDPATMPHILVREDDGSFTFKQAEWADRECGDEDTNPWPTFVDSPINDVFFFKNRLGFLSGENIILSEVGEYFNFFRTTATTLLDTDVVDATVSTNQVAILHNSAQASGRLFAFSDKLQFELTGDPLTPSTAALVNTTRYSANPGVKPVVGGDSIFFAFDRGSDFSGVREMIPKTSDNDETVDITSHVPHLVDGDIATMAFSTIENTLFVLPQATNQDTVFVYRTHWEDRVEGREKIVSAWSHWEFFTNILSVQVIDEYLYLVMFDGPLDRLYVSRVDLRDGVTEADWDWRVLLDMRVLRSDIDVVGVFSAPNTTFTLPYFWDNSFDPLKVIDMATAMEVATVSVNGTIGQVVIAGDQTAANLLFGLGYTADVQFSRPVLRRSSGDRSHPIPDGDLYILFWSVQFANSGRFHARVTQRDGSFRRQAMNAPIVTTAAPTGKLQSGIFKFPVRLKAYDGMTISIFNDTHFPSHLVNAGWEGNFILRSR